MNKRISIFFTSDWHIGHKNIIKFCPNRANSLEEMENILIRQFNSTVGENDVCYFLGDMGFSNSDQLKDVLSRLKCRTKILILGNHDLGTNAMYGAGFDTVLQNATLQIAGQAVSLSHCPLLGVYRENTEGMRNCVEKENWHGETRPKMRKFAMIDNGQFHGHGHLHAPNGGKSEVKLNRQWDFGVDGNNMTPVSISQVESWIVKTLKKEKEERELCGNK